MSRGISGSVSGEEGEFGLQIAPMLDLLFVLLIFFMASAGSRIKEAELGIKIPARGASLPGTVETPIQLDIDPLGQVLFNKTPIDTPVSKEMPGLKSKLTDVITKFGDTQPVIISPNAATRHERVVDVLNACSAARVKNLAFGAGST